MSLFPKKKQGKKQIGNHTKEKFLLLKIGECNVRLCCRGIYYFSGFLYVESWRMKLREQSNSAFQNILDTMTGADGGVRFLYFKVLIEEMDKRAGEGDADAK